MIRRIAAVAVAAVLIAAAAASPAAAQAEDAWLTTVTCANGAFTSKKPGVDDMGRPAIWLEGWIQPCDLTAPGDRFGVIYYVGDPVDGDLTGYVHLKRLRAYDGKSIGVDPVTRFSGTVDDGMRIRGPLLAVCVAYNDGGLVGCVDPSEDGNTTGPPAMELIARAPVNQIGDGAETHPNCATCL